MEEFARHVDEKGDHLKETIICKLESLRNDDQKILNDFVSLTTEFDALAVG